MDTYQRWKELGRAIDYLMECWLSAHSPDPVIKVANEWALMEPVDEARDNPERAWKCILFAARDPRFSDLHIGVMAAGVLEDLLSYDGAAFIDRAEEEVSKNRRFALMLGGVWRFQMSDYVWSRVKSV